MNHLNTPLFSRDSSPGPKHDPVVYYAVAELGGIVKIGTTVQLKRRMWNLSRNKAVALGVVAVESGGPSIERQRHIQYSAAHVGGDYYWLTPEIEAHMRRLDTPASRQFIANVFGGAA